MKLLVCLLLLKSLVPAAQAEPAAAQADPTATPAGTKRLLQLTGVGVQIYNCREQPGGPAWFFVAPQAKLLDGSTEKGSHSAGPTWALNDGSSVKGQLLATRPSPDPDAIPWLLLKAVENSGSGALTQVRYIRRSDTSGGKAPSTGCDVTHLGSTIQVPYKATYSFYTAAP
jgi:hypothetical protein